MRKIAHGIALSLLFAAPAAADVSLAGSSPLPSGSVAFTYKDGKQSDVYRLDFATGTVRPLVANPVDDEYPVWSPDGKKIAFYSDVSGDREIYVMNSDGTGVTQLTKNPGVDEDPEWSPDGKRIMFRSERDEGSNLYTMNADGSDQQRLTEGSAKRSVPRWSPQGDQILYSTNAHWPGWDIELLNLSSKEISPQTSGIRTFCHAAWHPNGKRFVYSHGGGSTINLWEKDIGGEDRRLTEFDGKDYDAVWVDDHRLLFSRELNPGKEDYQIYLIDVTTKAITRVTQNSGAIRDLSFHPRG